MSNKPTIGMLTAFWYCSERHVHPIPMHSRLQQSTLCACVRVRGAERAPAARAGTPVPPHADKLWLATGLNLPPTSRPTLRFPHAIPPPELAFTTLSPAFARERYAAVVVPEDKSYGKGHRWHALLPHRARPSAPRPRGTAPPPPALPAQRALTTLHKHSQNSLSVSHHKICGGRSTNSLWGDSAKPTWRASEQDQTYHRPPSAREPSPTRDDSKIDVPSFGACPTWSYAGQRCCCQ